MIVFLLLCLVVGLCGWGTIFSVLGWILFVIGIILFFLEIPFSSILIGMLIIAVIMSILGLIFDKDSREEQNGFFFGYVIILIASIIISVFFLIVKLENKYFLSNSIELGNIFFKEDNNGITPTIEFKNKNKKPIKNITFNISNSSDEIIKLYWEPKKPIECEKSETAKWENGIRKYFSFSTVEIKSIHITYTNEKEILLRNTECEYNLSGWRGFYPILNN